MTGPWILFAGAFEFLGKQGSYNEPVISIEPEARPMVESARRMLFDERLFTG